MPVSKNRRKNESKLKKKVPRIAQFKGVIRHWGEDGHGDKVVVSEEQVCRGKSVYHPTKGWRRRGNRGDHLTGLSLTIGFINRAISNESRV